MINSYPRFIEMRSRGVHTSGTNSWPNIQLFEHNFFLNFYRNSSCLIVSDRVRLGNCSKTRTHIEFSWCRPQQHLSFNRRQFKFKRFLQPIINSKIFSLSQSKVPSNSVKSASDTDVELYRMKTVSRKGLKDHPSVRNSLLLTQHHDVHKFFDAEQETKCDEWTASNNISLQRIEFQRMNRSVENRYKKDHKRHPPQRLHKCHCMLGPESAFSALNIPSQTAQKNNSLEPLGSCHSSQVFQPRSVRSKVHKMFSGWFQRRRSTPAKYNQEQPHDDAESGCSDGENVETYHFDHGSTSYYRTTDCPPHLISEIIAQRTTFHATKFWAEFFGSINIIVTFIITFFLQFYRWISTIDLVRKLHCITWFRVIVLSYPETNQ